MLLQPLPPCHAEDASARKIIELRALLAEKFPAAAPPPPARLQTGLSILDDLLDGGLPEAAITEIVSPGGSSGSGTFLHALIESVQAAGRCPALVDAGDSFDVDDACDGPPPALLLVRCRQGVEQALKAADLLARDGNLPLLILDLVMCAPRQVRAIPSTYWYRLQRVVEASGVTVVTTTPCPVVGSAACTLRLTRHFGLPALDCLRDQLTGQLRMDKVRARRDSPPGRPLVPLTLMAG